VDGLTSPHDIVDKRGTTKFPIKAEEDPKLQQGWAHCRGERTDSKKTTQLTWNWRLRVGRGKAGVLIYPSILRFHRTDTRYNTITGVDTMGELCTRFQERLQQVD
jgi:hypothetical protein